MGQAHPVWKEEVTFKSVQITSDLQVSASLPLPSGLEFMQLPLACTPVDHEATNLYQLWLVRSSCIAYWIMHGNKPDCTRKPVDCVRKQAVTGASVWR